MLLQNETITTFDKHKHGPAEVEDISRCARQSPAEKTTQGRTITDQWTTIDCKRKHNIVDLRTATYKLSESNENYE